MPWNLIIMFKILRENLAGNSCGTRRKAKSQFKKGSDWWKFSIWNRVMGSQPIRIQLWKSCRKILWENLVEILWEILVGQVGGEKANLRKEVIGGNLAFGIGWWGASQSGSSLEKSCGKILWKSGGKFCGKSCGKFLW